MAYNSKTIFVYDDFTEDKSVLLGRLYVDAIKGGETYSFEYDDKWLKNTGMTVNLDPDLMPYGGRQYPNGRSIFGIFADASPDRWGRVLMMKLAWAESDLSWIRQENFYQTIKRPRLRHGHLLEA